MEALRQIPFILRVSCLRVSLLTCFLLCSPFPFGNGLKIVHAFDLTELAGPTLTAPRANKINDDSYSSIPGVSWAAGLSFGIRILPQIDFAPEVIFANQNFALTSTQSTITHSVYSSIQIPLLLRYWINPYFSPAGGIFFSRTLGKVSVFTADEENPTVYQFSDLNWSQIDMGLMVSTRFRLPMNEVVGFIIDARVFYGLKNLDTSGTGQLKSSQVQILAGLHYTL